MMPHDLVFVMPGDWPKSRDEMFDLIRLCTDMGRTWPINVHFTPTMQEWFIANAGNGDRWVNSIAGAAKTKPYSQTHGLPIIWDSPMFGFTVKCTRGLLEQP